MISMPLVSEHLNNYCNLRRLPRVAELYCLADPISTLSHMAVARCLGEALEASYLDVGKCVDTRRN